MDRFAYGLADSQDQPSAIFGWCEYCREEIMLGDEIVTISGELYCDYRCFGLHLGAKEVSAGMDD